jgi:hypothetical protein
MHAAWRRTSAAAVGGRWPATLDILLLKYLDETFDLLLKYPDETFTIYI